MNTLPNWKTKAFWWATAFVLYAFLASSAIALTSNGKDIATLWPANAVLLALLLSRRDIGYIGVCTAGFAANVLANVLTRGSVSGPLLFGVSNVAEVVIAAAIIGARADNSQPLTSPSNIGRFLIGASIFAPAASALLGAITAVVVFDQPFLHSFETWYLSDALGLMIFTPPLWSLFNNDYVRCFRLKSPKERLEAVALHGLVFGVTAFVFFVTTMPLLFVVFAPVMLITFRVGRLGTEAATMVVAATGAVATIYGHGPIAWYTSDGADQSHLFQAFLAVLSLTCLPVVANLSARQQLASYLSQSALEQAERADEMEKAATIDSLTGVLNRGAFDKLATARLTRPTTVSACLVAIDLDHFKKINDNFGHAAGDAALVHLTTLLKSRIRSRDIIGRLGGDEFLILLDGTSENDAHAIVAQLKALVEQTALQLSGNVRLFVAMSCGVAHYQSGKSLKDLKLEADANLYRAKALREPINQMA